MTRAPAWSARVAAGGVAALAVWPFAWIVHSWPNSRDAVLWVTKGASRHWARWALTEEHFNVGYRPVTALSYTADWLVGGLRPEAYQLTDLALHLGCVLVVFALFRRLFPTHSAWGGVVAAAVVAVHPVSSIVVPHLARRGYPLATLLACAGLIALLPGESRVPDRLRVGAGTALLALGALSNEAGYVAFPVAGLLLAGRAYPSGWVAMARAVAGPVAVTVALLALRVALIGGMGGYHGDVDASERVWPIAVATWQGVAGLLPMRSDVGDPGGWAIAAMALVTVFYAARAAADRVRLALAAWLIGLLLAYVPQGVWFPREVYMALPPLALLVGSAAVETWTSERQRWARALETAPQVALAVALCWQSPVLLGPDPLQKAGWTRTDALIDDFDRALSSIPPASVVDAVGPHFERPSFDALRSVDSEESRFGGKQLFTWMSALHPSIRFGNWFLVVSDPTSSGPIGEWDGQSLAVPTDATVFSSATPPRVEARGPTKLLTPVLSGGFLYTNEGATGVIAPER